MENHYRTHLIYESESKKIDDLYQRQANLESQVSILTFQTKTIIEVNNELHKSIESISAQVQECTDTFKSFNTGLKISRFLGSVLGCAILSLLGIIGTMGLHEYRQNIQYYAQTQNKNMIVDSEQDVRLTTLDEKINDLDKRITMLEIRK